MKIEGDILQELQRLPHSLFDLYTIAFSQITALGPTSYQIALSALQLLLVAVRPISWDEFIDILQATHETSAAGISKTQILEICCNFLDDNEEQNRPRFSHHSVEEYLETQPDFGRGVANAKVASLCLNHFIQYPGWDNVNFRYVTLYLGSHLLETSAKEREPIRTLLNQLLLPSSAKFEQHSEQQQSFEPFTEWRRRVDAYCNAGFLRGVPQEDHRRYLAGLDDVDSAPLFVGTMISVSPLFATCVLGLDEIFSDIQPNVSELLVTISRSMIRWSHLSWEWENALRRYTQRNCLEIAILANHRDTISLICQAGVDVSARSLESQETPLVPAAKLGNAEVIKQLVGCGALLNILCKVNSDHIPEASPKVGDWRTMNDSENNGPMRPSTRLGFHRHVENRTEIQSPFYFKNEQLAAIHTPQWTILMQLLAFRHFWIAGLMSTYAHLGVSRLYSIVLKMET